MKIIVSSHQGNIYDETVDYVVIHNEVDGEFTIMNDHIPVVSYIEDGYIKLVRDKIEMFVVVVSGMMEFHDNVVTVLVQEAHIGKDAKSAKEHLLEIRKERLEKNRQETSDFTQKERELRENLKNANAGSL